MELEKSRQIVAEKLAMLRFSISQGEIDAAKGDRMRVAVFKNLLNRCDELAAAIGLPTDAEKTEDQCEPHRAENTSQS